jgi:isopentenyl-diphosphate Delta-isomerase
MPPASPQTSDERPASPLVEVLDARGQSVAVLPEAEARRQLLRHRTIAILLYDEAGRLYLRKRDATKSHARGRWDTTARGAVLAGESMQDAATRILEQGLGIHAERMRLVLEEPALPENGNEHLHVFALTRPELPVLPGAEQDARDYCFTPEELHCLLRDFRELVSPRFLLLAEAMRSKSVSGQWRQRP